MLFSESSQPYKIEKKFSRNRDLVDPERIFHKHILEKKRITSQLIPTIDMETKR